LDVQCECDQPGLGAESWREWMDNQQQSTHPHGVNAPGCACLLLRVGRGEWVAPQAVAQGGRGSSSKDDKHKCVWVNSWHYWTYLQGGCNAYATGKSTNRGALGGTGGLLTGCHVLVDAIRGKAAAAVRAGDLAQE